LSFFCHAAVFFGAAFLGFSSASFLVLGFDLAFVSTSSRPIAFKSTGFSSIFFLGLAAFLETSVGLVSVFLT